MFITNIYFMDEKYFNKILFLKKIITEKKFQYSILISQYYQLLDLEYNYNYIFRYNFLIKIVC